MKPLVVISIALVLCACGTLEERKLAFKRQMANGVGYCSFENFTWEDTGEDARFQRIEPDWHNNWHVTQCAGRDPEPLKCFGNGGQPLRCEMENGELEDYRRLTGLIE